jgi:D-3-phosphoglycerate dehydrogenase
LYKVVITDYEYKNIDKERNIIGSAGFELYDYQVKTEAELIEVANDADGMIVQYAEINDKVLSALKKCKIIVRYGIGVDNIDLAAATRYKIPVCNVPDYGVDEVSNQVITMMLCLAKKMPSVTRELRQGNWGYKSSVPLTRLQGQTVGLLGFGRIAQVVARKLSGFGVRLLANDTQPNFEAAKQLGVEFVDFDSLCSESDYLSLHCPLKEDSYHLIDEKALALMKPTAYLINTARGPIVCEEDLINALEQGRIAGAGIDVFENEPVSTDNKLLKMDNVIATPHIAWYSEQAIDALQSKAAEEVAHVLNGGKPRYLCNPEVLR